MAVIVPRPRTTMPAAQKPAAHCASHQQDALYGTGRLLQLLGRACPVHAGCDERVALCCLTMASGMEEHSRALTCGDRAYPDIRQLSE